MVVRQVCGGATLFLSSDDNWGYPIYTITHGLNSIEFVSHKCPTSELDVFRLLEMLNLK